MPYEKSLIANRLGMKPESFSRALGKSSEFGVTVDRESVRIRDVDRLAAFAEGRGGAATEIAPRSPPVLPAAAASMGMFGM